MDGYDCRAFFSLKSPSSRTRSKCVRGNMCNGDDHIFLMSFGAVWNDSGVRIHIWTDILSLLSRDFRAMGTKNSEKKMLRVCSEVASERYNDVSCCTHVFSCNFVNHVSTLYSFVWIGTFYWIVICDSTFYSAFE